MGYLICSKCKGYYKLQSSESVKDFINECDCGGKIRYVENLDIVDPQWKPITIAKKRTINERLIKKIKSLSKIPTVVKNRLLQFNQNIKNRINTTRNQKRINRNPQGFDIGMINAIQNELNFNNIRWTIVIPATVIIALILAYTPGIFSLLTFLILIMVGFLFDDYIIGIKNAAIVGAVSFFLGYLLIGSFLLIIPYAILGAINGAICGWIGGYIKRRIRGY